MEIPAKVTQLLFKCDANKKGRHVYLRLVQLEMVK